tara:strand:+ start:1277 stop:1462 length:186 start_codon:yes stop_codon:yes gene_type:complete
MSSINVISKKKTMKKKAIKLSKEDIALYKTMRELRGLPYNEFKTSINSILEYQKNIEDEKQ